MANAVELQVVQQEIEDARKEISGIKTSLGRAKTEKEAEYYLGQLTSLQSQMASLRSEKVLLLQAQQRGAEPPDNASAVDDDPRSTLRLLAGWLTFLFKMLGWLYCAALGVFLIAYVYDAQVNEEDTQCCAV